MKRYFVYSTYYKHDCGGSSASGYIITDGCHPSKRSIMNHHRIPSNYLNVVTISELKSAQDISDFLEVKVSDVVNYPLNPNQFNDFDF